MTELLLVSVTPVSYTHLLGELKAQGKEGDFSVTVCVTTLYSYIDKGILDVYKRQG